MNGWMRGKIIKLSRIMKSKQTLSNGGNLSFCSAACSPVLILASLATVNPSSGAILNLFLLFISGSSQLQVCSEEEDAAAGWL